MAVSVNANTIVRDAMREIGAIGISDTPEAEESQLALRTLNRMLDSWLTRNLYAYHVKWQQITLTSSQESRTIGPSGQVNIARPAQIEVGSYVRVSGIDTELRVVSRDTWAAVEDKSLVGARPEIVYYEAASPIGTLYFWPQADCDVFLAIQTQLTQFADLTTAYTLPPGYEDAIILSLAERLCRPFSRAIPLSLANDARKARAAVKALNLNVPELDMPLGNGLRGQSAFIGG